jgi:glycosyltransferase involved in cell wall biosynthesis
MRSKPFVPEVKRLAKSLGVSEHLLLLGERNDVPRLLGMADLFCLPSREEQLPLAVLEAMSAGLPIVATRVGGLPECIEHRQHGLLVPPEDPTALSTAINELLGDPSLGERLGAAAVARIAAEFRPDHCLTAIESVYQRVLEQERAPTRPRFKPAVILRQLI